MSDYPIAVCHKKLAKVLGRREEEITPELIPGWQQRMAARVLTDSQLDPERGPRPIEVQIANATSWVRQAYEDGRSHGKAEALREMRVKIFKLFGLEG